MATHTQKCSVTLCQSKTLEMFFDAELAINVFIKKKQFEKKKCTKMEMTQLPLKTDARVGKKSTEGLKLSSFLFFFFLM